MYIADLHIHSRYSRATSKECTPEHLDLWARRKGIDLLGTGDFTHPAWRKELAEKLLPAEDGLYRLKDELRFEERGPAGAAVPRFVISGEISSIYKKNGRVRKVHNVILLPGLSEAETLSERLETIGNLHSDGRPILGLDSRDLLEITLEVCPRAIFIPAHIWTPHFSMFGAFSGFDTVEECFEDMTPHIRAVETGLSSDPPMNWRLSALDRFRLVSNSDAHSPSKLGREANLLEIPMSYDGLYAAIQEGRGLSGTIEFFPEEGKYHYDGHRKCGVCVSPMEAERLGDKCPVCGKKLTLGVFHRVVQLADREEGFIRPQAKPFERLAPLMEVLAASTGRSATSKPVQKLYQGLLQSLGPEFAILRDFSLEEIQKKAGSRVCEGIRRLRLGEVERIPGFDGEYGVIRLFTPSELADMEGQLCMFQSPVQKEERAGKPWEKGQEAAGEQEQASLKKRSEDRKRQAGEKKAVGDACEPVGEESDMGGASGLAMPETAGRKPVDSARPSLNEEQCLAARSVSPRTAVLAGPGTGKTKTLVSHIEFLLTDRRVRPSEITAVTFTRQAANELRNRIKELPGGKNKAGKLCIGTFHSVCLELLREAGKEFVLADENAAFELIRETALELGIEESPKRLREAISRRKTGIESDPAEPEYIAQAAARYEERLAGLSALDFDDLLLQALLRAEAGEDRLPYLLIDEFQDISPLQYRLIRAWGLGNREIFAIGDPNQAIYGFRGADFSCFERFIREEKAEVIRLRHNYRSTPEILAVSGEVLKPSGPLLEPMLPSGPPVRLLKAGEERDEAIFIAKEINRMVGGMDMLDVQEEFSHTENRGPRSFAEIAILCRTHQQMKLLEMCLKREGIPYIVAGREEFLHTAPVRESLGVFKCLLDPGDLLARHLYESVLSDSPGLEEKYREMCQKGKPRKVWDSWIEERGLSKNPDMEKLAAMAVFYKSMKEMLEGLALGRESDLKRCGGKRYVPDAVTIMTMHGSKGLEFPAVFLYGMQAGLVPLVHKGKETDPDEERRLLYVAITRAKEELILTASGAFSTFLQGIPEKLLLRERIRPVRQREDEGKQLSLFEFMQG